MNWIKERIFEGLDKVAKNAVATLLAMCGSFIWAKIPSGYFFGLHPIKGYFLIVFYLTVAYVFGDWIQRTYKWWEEKQLWYVYQQFENFDWELSPEFIKSGYMTSPSEMSSMTLMRYVNGPFSLCCHMECAKHDSNFVPPTIFKECPNCNMVLPDIGDENRLLYPLATRAYAFFQSRLRKDKA